MEIKLPIYAVCITEVERLGCITLSGNVMSGLPAPCDCTGGRGVYTRGGVLKMPWAPFDCGTESSAM